MPVKRGGQAGHLIGAGKPKPWAAGAWRFRDGQQPQSAYHGYIYPDEFERLAQHQADVLVLHEAPSSHPYGFAVLDELARRIGVKRVFHGHHHDDRSAEYRQHWASMGFETYAVGSCGIRNHMGEEVLAPQPF